jgi:UDPglucose 6-dehydrogenase
MVKVMFNTLTDKKIALFGFAFKANTGDTRESPAIGVAKKLIEERAKVIVTDPEAIANAKIDLKEYREQVVYEPDPYRAVEGAHAFALMTEWDLYTTLDYEKIFAVMEKPAFVFDGRNILDHKRLHSRGFNVFPIGKPALKHF